MAGIKEWWINQSKGAKALYIIGGIGLIATGVYFATRKKEDDSSKKTPTTDSKTQELSEQTSPNQDIQPVIDVTTLPNKGVGCGSVKMTYDRDFDYVKCDGIWYTKSKPNAASQFAKGLYKDWTSLKDNSVATERLERRYPNG